MIDLNKKYQTRDGREVRLFMVDGGGEYPIVGAYKDGKADKWTPDNWASDGRWLTDHSDTDLVPVPEKRVGYVNVRRLPSGEIWLGAEHPTRASADKKAGEYRIACIRIEYTEGQFDE